MAAVYVQIFHKTSAAYFVWAARRTSRERRQQDCERQSLVAKVAALINVALQGRDHAKTLYRPG
ncbi:MAG: hypothetical protein L0G50_13725, partial [Pseudomonas sp.]|nr:hypothetical protein [Pseudomonas sp.]